MFKLLGAIVENGRLAAENESLRQDIQALKAELTDAKKQVYAEIDSNRNREDALIDIVAQLRTPMRRPLLPHQNADDAEFEELVFDKPRSNQENEEQEELVLARARDYAKEYARRGIAVDFDDLCQRIRSNPDEYLSN